MFLDLLTSVVIGARARDLRRLPLTSQRNFSQYAATFSRRVGAIVKDPVSFAGAFALATTNWRWTVAGRTEMVSRRWIITTMNSSPCPNYEGLRPQDQLRRSAASKATIVVPRYAAFQKSFEDAEDPAFRNVARLRKAIHF